MGNRKVGAPIVLNADMDQLMESGSPACYHTTVPQRARSFQDALEMLHLTGDTGDSALSLRDAILLSLYPELDDKEYENRFLGMKGSDYWAEHAGQVRLVKCQRESELQGIAAEPWYFLYWSNEHQGLKPFHPLDTELSVGDRDRSPYGVVRPVPSCAIWNFLDNELEIDVPLMNVEEWSDFVRGRSCADQKRMTLVMTRVLVQARLMDRTCQVMYNEIWKLQDRLHSEKGKVEVMVRTCDSARRAGNNHLLNLRGSQAQSEDLQAEMRTDMRGLEEQLAAANEQAGALKVCLTAMQETAKTKLAQKERELLLSTSELASATKELKAMKVRELELRDSLGRANAEALGLSAQVAALSHKSDLLAQELADSKASWALERASLRANAAHHEGVGATASLEVESLRGELAAAKLATEEARLRQLSPEKAGRVQGSGMHMMMDTPVVGDETSLVGSPMGGRAVGSGIPMTPMWGPSSQDLEPKKPPVEGTSEGLTAIAQRMIPDRFPGYPSTSKLVCGAYKDKSAGSHILDGSAGCRHRQGGHADDRVKDSAFQGDAGQPRSMA